MKNHIHSYIAENHKVTTGHEFLTAATSNGGITGVSFYLGYVDDLSEQAAAEDHDENEPAILSPAKKRTKTAQPDKGPQVSAHKKPLIPGISLYHDFEFSKDNKDRQFIRVWRHYGIGEGLVILNKHWENKGYQTQFKLQHAINPQRGLWNLHPSVEEEERELPIEEVTESSVNVENDFSERAGEAMTDMPPEDSQLTAQTLFQCPEETCTAEFSKWGNLQQHLITGKHKSLPSHESLYDYAMKLYSEKLESISFQQYPEMMEEAVQNLVTPSDTCQTEEEMEDTLQQEQMGWALKKRVERKPLTHEQIRYLLQKYNEGEISGRKVTGQQVAEQMRKEKVDGKAIFLPQDWLKWTSIQSYFSRETQRRRKKQLEPVAATVAPRASELEEEICPVQYVEEFDPSLETANDPDQDYLYDDTLTGPQDAVREGFLTQQDNLIEVVID